MHANSIFNKHAVYSTYVLLIHLVLDSENNHRDDNEYPLIILE